MVAGGRSKTYKEAQLAIVGGASSASHTVGGTNLHSDVVGGPQTK